MRGRTLRLVPVVLATLAAAACDTTTTPLAPDGAALARAGYDSPGAHRQYGVPIRLGDGMARVYVVLDARQEGAPLEIGIALSEKALNNLSASGPTTYMLPLPTHAPEPYTFAMLDWNPQGHEPPGVYTVPHFDFHFYTVPEAQVTAILPSAPDFASEANNVPTGDFVPPYYVVLGPPGSEPVDVAVPQMGVHWSDVRSPELQGMLGHPEDYEPFTKTFIYGSWDGEFTFLEPMVTRGYLLGASDEIIEIPTPAARPQPGWYPSAYRITYDPQAKEYRIGLTHLTWSN